MGTNSLGAESQRINPKSWWTRNRKRGGRGTAAGEGLLNKQGEKTDT